MATCPLCDSSSHDISKCTRVYKYLHHYSFNNSIMCHDNPDFTLFSTKELKLFAFVYKFKKCVNPYVTSCNNTPNYKKKYEFSPITINSPRKRLIKALQRRWLDLVGLRMNVKEKASEECPICYENMVRNFNHHVSRWDIKFRLLPCKHKLCDKCFHTIIECRNTRASCPLCRGSLYPASLVTSLVK